MIEGDVFRVIRQLTYQMEDVRRDPMIEQGWTPDIDRFLYDLAKSVPKDKPPVRVRIVVNGQYSSRPAPQAEAPASSGEIVRSIPRYICELWPSLLTTTWELLGTLEARYRTGFNEDEIRAALVTMTASVAKALES
ncbi:hypothetical protein IT779_21500 [Nocardia sp. NEAU-351]|uniref:Uncharacterized protein n=1 Tax=Nocardia bovistercoris TaxID=2785916 RepID=A0A931ICF6_9NOCA|nr:hypothetical protein [Nocardia bovistercoris]